MKIILLITTCFLAFNLNAYAVTEQIGNTKIGLSGFIKVDSMFTDYKDGTPISSAIDDFYIPLLIPTNTPGNRGNGPGVTFNAHAKQSRFRLKSSSEMSNGKSIDMLLEMDFGPGSSPSNGEKTTNRSGVDLRHALITYGHWKVGQTYTNLLNGSSVAEMLNAFPLADGMVDPRQVQVRYTSGDFSFSLENSETTLQRRETKDSSLPDMTVKYSVNKGWGNVSIAAIARQLKYHNKPENINETRVGGGISIAGKIHLFATDDIRFGVTSGVGLGRYLGLALNDDAYIQKDKRLQTIDQTAGTIAYRHFWNNKTRTNIGYAFYKGNANKSEVVFNETSESIHINLLHSISNELMVGSEYFYAKLSKSNNEIGAMSRLQFSAKYDF